MRRRFSYANVAATLALVFAMSGGALAASRYLINSTNQINPKVLGKLRGNRGSRGNRGPRGYPGLDKINSTKQINPKVLRELRGARGPRGALGPNGAIGPQGVGGETGPKGSAGPKGEPGFSALSQLPSGKTESGEFALSTQAKAPGETLSTAVTFSVPLATSIAGDRVEFVSLEHLGANCAGPGTAARGFLCVYTSAIANLASPSAYDPEAKEATAGSGLYGAGLSWAAVAEGASRVTGTYSVTGG